MVGNGECWRAPAWYLRALENLKAILLLAILSFGVTMSADAQSGGAVDVLARQRGFASIGAAGALTRGGLWLAYTVRTGVFTAVTDNMRRYTSTGMLPDYATGTELRVSNTRLGKIVPLSDGQAAVADPAWAPDGNQLAFYSDRGGMAHLWLWNGQSGQERLLSDAAVRPSFSSGANLKWTPDGKYLITLLLPKGLTLPQADARAQKTARDADQLLAAMSAELALIDVANGEVKRLSRDRPVFWYAPSPDGKLIAFSYASGRAPATGQWLYSIEVVATDGSASRVVAEYTNADDGFCAWSPDSTRLAYFASGTGGRDGVHVVDVIAKTDREASSVTFSTAGPNDVHRRVLWMPDGASMLFVFNGKLWRTVPQTGETMTVTAAEWKREVVQIVSQGQTSVAWTREGGRSVTVTTRDRANQNMGFYRVELATGKVTMLREEAKRYGDYNKPAIASEDGTFVMWAAEDENSPLDLWGAGPNLKEPLRLTQLNR
jgi:Tol biopolymer transport system component